MIIAHLPAGYLLSTWLQTHLPPAMRSSKAQHFGLLGSVFPDFDLLYFYLLDDRQHHHHRYWPHLPVVWLVLSVLVLHGLWRRGHPVALGCALMLLANVWLHLLLDSWVGDIWWLYPLFDQPFALFQVPAGQNFWLWSFVGHWTFAAEIVLLVSAFRHWQRNKHIAQTGSPNQSYRHP